MALKLRSHFTCQIPLRLSRRGKILNPPVVAIAGSRVVIPRACRERGATPSSLHFPLRDAAREPQALTGEIPLRNPLPPHAFRRASLTLDGFAPLTVCRIARHSPRVGQGASPGSGLVFRFQGGRMFGVGVLSLV